MYIKVQFENRNNPGEFSGKKYQYSTTLDVQPGDLLRTGRGGCVRVCEVDVDPEINTSEISEISKYWTEDEPAAAPEPVTAIAVSRAMPDIKTLITVEQLPIITQQLPALREIILADVDAAKSLEVTEETVKRIKEIRANLNRDHANIDEQMKAVKAAVLAPWEEFLAVYKTCVSQPYNDADSALKARICAVEGGLKDGKRTELLRFYHEYRAAFGIDWLPFERTGIKVGLADSLKSLKNAAQKFVDEVCNDLSYIKTQQDAAEILVEYKKSLKAMNACAVVAERKKARAAEQVRIEAARAIQAEQARVAETVSQAEILVAPIAKPAVTETDDPVLTLPFKVKHRKSKLKELKKYLIEGGFEIVT